jgi:hypothetical protein
VNLATGRSPRSTIASGGRWSVPGSSWRSHRGTETPSRGFAFGYPLPNGDAHWWAGLRPEPPEGFAAKTGARTFVLAEIEVRRSLQGGGVGRQLHDASRRANTRLLKTAKGREGTVTAARAESADQDRADAQAIWDYHQVRHPARLCSAGIGLGSQDLGVAALAADLYHTGLFPVLVFTGANSPTTAARFPRGEAVHFAEHATRLGVPASAVIIEPEAANTGQNIEFSRRALAVAQAPPPPRPARRPARPSAPGVGFLLAFDGRRVGEQPAWAGCLVLMG